jgi:hypothetical protein
MRCLWTQDDEGNYDAACGNKFTFINEGPTENNFTYCPYCGRVIKEEQPKETPDL